MTRRLVLAHSMLWAAAVVAAAALHAPTFLWLVLLPCLAPTALLITHPSAAATAERSRAC
jgi:hypothetical protein